MPCLAPLFPKTPGRGSLRIILTRTLEAAVRIFLSHTNSTNELGTDRNSAVNLTVLKNNFIVNMLALGSRKPGFR